MRIAVLPAPTPALEALVDRHVAFCDATAPAESCHRLPVSALFGPGLTLWAAEDDSGALIGMGALKALPIGGEVKSMHTAAAARGQGAAKAILRTIIAEAERRGMPALWLETGTHPDFAAARALYAKHGFTECPPFGDYTLDPNSLFMTKTLEAAQ